MRPHRYLFVLLAVMLATTTTLPTQAAITYNTIAFTGSTGTNLGVGPSLRDGIDFQSFGTPAVSSSGQVTFFAWLVGNGVTPSNNESIWTTVGGSPTLIAREGVTSPGPAVGSGVQFESFGTPVLNASGELAFLGRLKGAGVNDSNDLGIWTNVGENLTLVARTGPEGPGPNLGTGVNFGFFLGPVFNSTGEVVFYGTLDGLGNGSLFEGGFFSNAGGTLSVLARVGSDGPSPNVEDGAYFSLFPSTPSPMQNAAGNIAFYAHLSGSGITSSNDRGIWIGSNGNLTAVARKGSVTLGPHVGEGVYFSNSFAGLTLNSENRVAFRASLEGTGVDSSNNQGIWTNSSGSLAAVARTGSQGPGPNLGENVYFSFLLPPEINAAGAVAFKGEVAGSGVTASNNSGIWTNVGGSLVAIAQEGIADLPCLGDGIYFRNFDGFALNSAGQIAFRADLGGTGIDSSNDEGIWFWTGGEIIEIVRTGDLFDINPDPAMVELRTVSAIDSLFTSYGGDEGKPMTLNDSAVLVFKLIFTDLTEGIFTVKIAGTPLMPGDFDGDGDVDGADFVAWQTNFPTASGATLADGDADGDGDVDGADFVVWQTNFPFTPATGASPVPEPAAGLLALMAAIAIPFVRRVGRFGMA